MKKTVKRLKLAKETVRNLEAGELRPVVGGVTETCRCPWVTDIYGSCPCPFEEVEPSVLVTSC